jgi:hypothetical protein
MSASRLSTALRMAAPAAILILLPGVALAEVCDKASLNLANHLPFLDNLLKGQADGDQFRKFFTPESLITGAILIWLIASNSTRSTITAMAWFLCLSIYHALAWFSIDLADPYYQAAITEGCVEPTPRHILSNLGFALIAGLLTWQRIRRQKSG